MDPFTMMILGSFGSSLAGSIGSIFGSQAQAGAIGQGIQNQQAMFAEVLDKLRPFIKAGQSAIPTLEGLLTPGPNQTQILSQTPGFQFAQDWGQKAVQNAGQMRGVGGNVLTELQKFSTGLAQNTFFPLVQSLQGLVNTGADAASSLGGTAANFGSSMGNMFSNLGGAQASGILGASNAVGSGFNSLANYMMLQSILQGSQNKPTTMYGAP